MPIKNREIIEPGLSDFDFWLAMLIGFGIGLGVGGLGVTLLVSFGYTRLCG